MNILVYPANSVRMASYLAMTIPKHRSQEVRSNFNHSKLFQEDNIIYLNQ
ncbi:MAG: hypothetical protein LBS80_05470 [Tannerella sp.]|nr:hypothetical protein [Tannerella sp.]